MGELKSEWQRVKFGQVVRLCRETCKNPAADGIKRVIGLEHLEPGNLRLRSWSDITEGTTFTNRVRPGQVLFGKRRAYQRKVAVADFDAICSSDIYLFEAIDPTRLLPELLPYLCQADAFFEYAVGTSAGSLSPRTNWSSLAEYEFALPPLNEQRRLLTAYQAVSSAIEQTSILIDAASVAKSALSNAIMASGLPSTLRPLRDYCTRVGVGIATSATHAYRDSGVPMIRNTDIEPGRVNTSNLLFIDPEFDRQNSSKRVRAGDVVVARTGAPGTAAVVPASLDACQTFTTLIVSPNRELLLPDFLCAWINGSVSQSFINSRKGGGVQQNMNATLLELLPTWTPSLPRQREVVDILRAATESIDSVRSRRDAASSLLQNLINGNDKTDRARK